MLTSWGVAEALDVFDDVAYVLFGEGVPEEVGHEVRCKTLDYLGVWINDRAFQVFVVGDDGLP